MNKTKGKSKKKSALFILWTGYITIALLFSGCGTGNEISKTDFLDDTKVYSKDLDKLFPDKMAFWKYTGTAEYMHVMEILSVIETKGQKIYQITGEVADVSEGESKEDYTFSLTYTISDESISQSHSGFMFMDKAYDKITLIQAPLEKGHSWRETTKNEKGEQVTITGTIESIEKISQPIYTVKYLVEPKGGIEIRKIKEGTGVVSYEKQMIFDNEKFPVGYKLYELKKGDNQLGEKKKKPNLALSPSLLDSDEAKKIKEKANAEKISKDQLVDLDHQPTDEQRKTLEKLILEFNQAWKMFANEKRMEVLDYITKNGAASKIVKKFPAGTMHLDFKVIDIAAINVYGNRAQIYVHEVIDREKQNKFDRLIYYWLYDLVKKEEGWRIESYTSQPPWK